MVTPKERLAQILALLLVIITAPPVRSHEQPTHVEITQRALAYLGQADNQRFKVLSQKYGFFPLSSALADGSFNEDAAFGNQCSAPCPFLGRFYFHFLPRMNDTLTLGDARIGLGASCSSLEWGISGGSCAAFLVPLGPPTGQPLLDTPESHGAMNDHTWSRAIAETDTGGAPTLEGWRHLSYLIHLLEDLTSPPHTRSSAHPCPGGFGPFCDPLDSLNLAVLPGQINLPQRDYVGLSNVGSPADLFRNIRDYTARNYFSARTAFQGEGPATTGSDGNYFYGVCLDVSQDVGTCGVMGRKIAHKGQQFYASGIYGPPDPRKADLDTTIGEEQFRELGPVAVLGVAALIKYYAPMLTVSIGGNGHGTVTSTSGTLNCTNTNTPCAVLLAQTTSGPPSAVLTATPTSGSVFTSWSGDCSGTATSATVNLIGDKTCTANFALKPKLTVTVSGSGSVVSSPAGINCGTTCVAPFLPNSQVTLTATPASGATFSGWSGACSGTSTSVTLTMSSDKTCTASFTTSQFSLLVTWTVSPTEANGWSGTKTLTVTNQNWTYTGTLTNANGGCTVMRSESSSGQLSIPVAPNPPVTFTFPLNINDSWTNTYCPAQSRANTGGSGAPAGAVTIVATPVSGGSYTLSTNTTYLPGDYYGGGQMTVIASGVLN